MSLRHLVFCSAGQWWEDMGWENPVWVCERLNEVRRVRCYGMLTQQRCQFEGEWGTTHRSGVGYAGWKRCRSASTTTFLRLKMDERAQMVVHPGL